MRRGRPAAYEADRPRRQRGNGASCRVLDAGPELRRKAVGMPPPPVAESTWLAPITREMLMRRR